MYIEILGIRRFNMKNQNVKYENQYVSDVAKGIRNKKQKRLLCDELESHILDKAEYYEEIGYTKEEALQKATEEMGNPDDVVIPMNNLHYSDWYEDPLSFDSIILLTIQAVLLFFFSKNLIYAEYGAVHYVFKDFISLLILGFNLYVIYRARKEKNKHVLILESISLIFQFFFNPYQPLFYGVASSFFDNYASNYADYIFSYRFISDQTFDILNVAPYILIGIMLCYCIVTAILIHLQEQGKKIKMQWQIIKAVGATALIFFGMNFAFMTASTLVAYPQKEAKRLEVKNTEIALYKYLTDFDTKNKTFEQVNSELFNGEALGKYGAPEYMNTEVMVLHTEKEYDEFNGEYENCNDWYYFVGDMVVIVSDWMHSDYYSITIQYAKEYQSDYNNYDLIDEFGNRDLICEDEEFDFIKTGMTLGEFLKNDLIKKAILIEFPVGKQSLMLDFRRYGSILTRVYFDENYKLCDIKTWSTSDADYL